MTQRGLILAVAVILLISSFGMFEVAAHGSCQRTATTRQGLRIFFASAAQRAQERERIDHGTLLLLDQQAVLSDQRAADSEPVAACSGLLL